MRASLLEFRRQFGVFPGLSEVHGGAQDAYVAKPNVARGRLGFTDSLALEEFEFLTGTARFPTRVRWELAADRVPEFDSQIDESEGTIEGPRGTHLRIDALNSQSQGDAGVRIPAEDRAVMRRQVLASLMAGDVDKLSGACRWQHRDAVSCEFLPTVQTAGYRVDVCDSDPPPEVCRSYDVLRRYEIRLNHWGSATEDEHTPTRAVLLRGEAVQLAAPDLPGFITVTDWLDWRGASAHETGKLSAPADFSLSMSLQWSQGARPKLLAVSGIYVEPRTYREGRTELSRFGPRRAGDLPFWFARQGWMAQTFVAFADSQDCLLASRCTVRDQRVSGLRNSAQFGPTSSKEGVIVMAGAPFAWQDRAPSESVQVLQAGKQPIVERYLEGGNVELLRGYEGRTYEARPKSNTFNDLVLDIGRR